jgi:hypothetical protein
MRHSTKVEVKIGGKMKLDNRTYGSAWTSYNAGGDYEK